MFSSRVSLKQNGRIWFTSSKDGNNQVGAALVFDFASKISGRKSAQVNPLSQDLAGLDQIILIGRLQIIDHEQFH